MGQLTCNIPIVEGQLVSILETVVSVSVTDHTSQVIELVKGGGKGFYLTFVF